MNNFMKDSVNKGFIQAHPLMRLRRSVMLLNKFVSKCPIVVHQIKPKTMKDIYKGTLELSFLSRKKVVMAWIPTPLK